MLHYLLVCIYANTKIWDPEIIISPAFLRVHILFYTSPDATPDPEPEASPVAIADCDTAPVT